MSKCFKNLILSITTLSLCLPVFWNGYVLADDDGGTPTTPEETTVRKLYVDYMGIGTQPKDSAQGKPRFTKDNINDEFWVGVAVDNVNDLDLFKNGVYVAELAFEYDPDYLEPYFISTLPEEDWKAAIETNNTSSANTSLLWNTSQYIFNTSRATDVDIDDQRESLTETKKNDWKMCTVCVQFKSNESFTNPRFKDIADSSKQYLIRVPFKLKAVPAANAADINPNVLSLVRGPQTLNIGAGDDGNSPYSEWEKDMPDPDDQTNMHTLFTYNGDLSLFDAGAAVTNITAAKPKSGEETEDTVYKLSKDNTIQGEGFDQDVTTYYLSVPNEVEKIRLDITSSEIPTVKKDDKTITTNADSDNLYKTVEISLAELNKDKDNDGDGEADGFNNKVTVESGGITYTIYIQRLIKPKIVLLPGNSPYGLIERMSADYCKEADKVWDADKIQQAKDAFNSQAVNKKYGTDLVPINGEPSLLYTTVAWSKYKDEENNVINYDLDPYALFVYQGSTFKEPGCIIYDEEGEIIDNPVVEIEVKVKKQLAAGVSKYGEDSGYVDYDIPLLDGTTDTYTLNQTMVRMDVYKMSYIYKYSDKNGQSQQLVAERPFILLSRMGDIYLNLTPTVNTADVDYLKKNTQRVNTGNSLVAFRCMNLSYNVTPTVNTADVDYLKKNTQKVNTSKVQFYKNVD